MTASGQTNAPMWKAPDPYGEPAAVEMMGSVAAPLLAGFSLTFLLLVVTNASSFRWPGPVLFAFAVSAVVMIFVVQFTFWARSYTVTPDELKSWWPDLDSEERQVVVRGEQLGHETARRIWANRARWAYRLGIFALLIGMAIALIPPTDVTLARWAASLVVLIGLSYESLWMVASLARRRGKTWKWVGRVAPTARWTDPR